MAENVEQILAEINILVVKGNFSEAERKAKIVLNLFDGAKKENANFVWILNLLAEISYRHKKYDESLAYAERALSLIQKQFGPNHFYAAASLSFIGLAQMKLRKFPSAKITFKNTLQLIDTSYGKNTEKYLLSLQNLARVCSEMGDSIECETHLEESMEVYQSVFRNNFASMDYNERMSLSDKFFSYQLQIFNYVSNNQTFSDSFLKKVFDFRLNTKMMLLENLETYAWVNNTFEKIKDSLHTDEIAIEVVRFHEMEESETGKSRYVFWVVSSETKNAPKVLTLYANPAKERKDYTSYIKNIQKKSVDFDSYEIYWKFLTSELKDKKQIYFSPDGVYSFINVNTIVTETGTSLIDEYNIRLYNDLRNVIERDQEKTKLPTEALLLADPTFYKPEVYVKVKNKKQILTQLPESKKEIKNVNEILERINCRTSTFCDEEVTKAAFENISKVQLLHIATHGNFNNNFSTFNDANEMMHHSGLYLSHPFVFSKEKKDLVLIKEGYLSSGDVVKMDLNNLELVVLSACNSGLGVQIKTGDSFGFLRTFFVAGAHNLITSLWEVEDKITHEFMKLFYSYWTEEQNKSSAFYRAQREMKRKYRYPMYWGSFILMHR